MKKPNFQPEQFTATQWSSAADKAKPKASAEASQLAHSTSVALVKAMTPEEKKRFLEAIQ